MSQAANVLGKRSSVELEEALEKEMDKLRKQTTDFVMLHTAILAEVGKLAKEKELHNKLAAKLATSEEKLAATEEKLAATEEKLAATEEKLAATEKDLNELKEKYSVR